MGTRNQIMAEVVKITVKLVVDAQVRICFETVANDVNAPLLATIGDVHLVTQVYPVALSLEKAELNCCTWFTSIIK